MKLETYAYMVVMNYQKEIHEHPCIHMHAISLNVCTDDFSHMHVFLICACMIVHG